MIFNGFPPSSVGIAAAALLVFVAILYLIRVRRRRVEVSSLGLWRGLALSAHQRRWRDWLKRLISFLLCAVIVALIALALIDPRQEENSEAHFHTVYIFDASGSMAAAASQADQAQYGCASRFSCALAAARQSIEAMRPDSRAVIIEASGMAAAVSGPFQADKSALLAAAENIKPRASSVAINDALALAKNLLRGKENPKIVFFTDGQFEINETTTSILPQIKEKIAQNSDGANAAGDDAAESPDSAESAKSAAGDDAAQIPLEQITFGPPDAPENALANISVNAFNARRYIADRLSFEVFAKVSNTSDFPVTADLTIYALPDGVASFAENDADAYKAIAQKRITIASGGYEVRIWSDLPLESPYLAAKLEIVSPSDAVDALPADDIAYAHIPDYAAPKILLLTPGDLYLEAALLLNENCRVAVAAPTDPRWFGNGKIDIARAAREFDIVIADNSYGNLPPLDAQNAEGNIIWVAPPPENAPYPQTVVSDPVVERVNAKHPIGRWLALRNLNIESSAVYRGVASSDTVIRAVEGPIAVTRQNGALREVAIGFGLVRSDIIFRVALPILFINAIDWLMYEKTEPERGFETGNAWHIDVAQNIDRVDIARPDGTTAANIPVFGKKAVFFGEDPGFYAVAPSNGDTGSKTVFAANFAQTGESDINRAPADLSSGPPAAAPESSPEPAGIWTAILSFLPDKSRHIWVLALLLAFALLAVEWALYHRRITV